MDRFITSTVSEFERLMRRLGRQPFAVDARYPPGCDPPSGPLSIRRLGAGGIAVDVETREFKADDFRLSVLFSNGTCIFGDVLDLARFWRTAVAAAFGHPVVTEAAATDKSTPTDRSSVNLRLAPPDANQLHARLKEEISGQDVALAAVASAVARHLAKSAPRRPETILLLGPSGTGKTATAEALPRVLADFCFEVAVFRVDCNELADSYDAKRFLGAAPGLVGYTDTPPLARALSHSHPIILFDEIERAHADVRQALLRLLDEGRLIAPNGREVPAPAATITMTSNAACDELATRLFRVAPDNAWAVRRECRSLLLDLGWPREFVSRVGTIAVYEELQDDAMDTVARKAVDDLATEYGLEIIELPDVLIGAIRDMAERAELDARGMSYAARDLLGPAFATAAREGLEGPVSIDVGPPPLVRHSGVRVP